MNKLIYRLSMLVCIFQISASELLSSPEKSWPRSENGKMVVKEFQLESRLERVTKIPTAVPNNYLITFRLEGKDAPADIFRVKYSKYRGKVELYEPFLLAGPGSSWQLTIDAIAVNPPTDKRFGGIQEYRHDDLTLLVGTLKDVQESKPKLK